MSDRFDLFEAIYTTRAIRKFKPDPIPPPLLRRVLEAATQAPSGMNRQPWRFVVVTDPGLKRELGDIYRRGYFGNRGADFAKQAEADPRAYLGLHMADAPMLVLACGPAVRPDSHPMQHVAPYASVFPAVQNMLLAARALGLGGVITINHRWFEQEAARLIDLPADQQIMAMVPLGYPTERHGKKTRMPVEEVTYLNRWGAHASFAND
ncbi:MAG: nitroreductase [SAR202 cluster bacterium]|nr:nitroreductase [SAR202 cluster bacterium]